MSDRKIGSRSLIDFYPGLAYGAAPTYLLEIETPRIERKQDELYADVTVIVYSDFLSVVETN